MNHVVILEGPDGSGKTSLAKELVEKHGYVYRHEGPPPRGADKLQYYAQKLDHAVRGRRPVVLDRFHLGELVYGPIARNEDGLTYAGKKIMDRLIAGRDVLVLICLPPYDVAHLNWLVKVNAADDFLKKTFDEDHEELTKRYHDSYYRFKALSAYHPVYDYANPTIRRAILNQISRRAVVSLPDGVVGNRLAKYLVLGERTNNQDGYDLPFFTMSNCSGYLNQSLWEAGYHEKEMAFTNVLDPAGDERDLATVRQYLPHLKKVLAFGKLAEKAASRLSVIYPPGRFVHPSCLKRFHYNERHKLVAALKKERI